jgi:PAS domain S-box-containing protein
MGTLAFLFALGQLRIGLNWPFCKLVFRAQEMVINRNKKSIKLISLINHSIGSISYTTPVVRLYVFLYTVVQTTILKCSIFMRGAIINNLNHLVRQKMSERNIIIKKLDTPELIEDACALLYVVHFELGGWKFSTDNPSQLRVEIKDGRKLLVDRFTDNAIWFGAFDNSQLLGCARLTFVDENNKLEMESYENSAIIQQYLPKDKSRCAEIARCAVLQGKNNLGVRISDLFLAAFRYCEEKKYSILAASHNVYIISLFKKIGYPLKKEHAFKYEEPDVAPVNFYFADYNKEEVKKLILNLENYRKEIKQNNSKMLDALEIVAPILPTVVYWHDTQGAILGVNPHCLRSIGATTDIIGKTPYDFYPKEIAEHILSHNELVMKTGEILSQDEPIEDVSTGEVKVFHSTKAPLYNDAGKVIGIIGSSIDVTAEKEAERLKIENEKQKTLLEKEEEFRKIANQVSHDIRSPLSSLLMILKSCTQIPEPQRIALREAATGARDIANHLLNQYKKHEVHDLGINGNNFLLVSTALLEVLTAKKYQYEDLDVHFDCHFEDNTHFAFIQSEFSDFRRMISNLINNAVDAMADNKGAVNLHLSADKEQIKISIQDAGKGMSPELIAKIMNKTAFTEGKKEGHGIGLTQVWDTINKSHGKMHIDSIIGKGTNLILTFPRADAPTWLAEEVILNPDDTVIILDDDASIHGAWQTRFENTLDKNSSINRKHFREGKDALEFIHSFPDTEKSKLFLLSDYELLKQELNGLHIIAKGGVSRSILVTSHYADPIIQEQAAKTGTKILPKELASEVPIHITETEKTEVKESAVSRVEVVLVDDDEALSDNMVNYIFQDKVVDQYLKPEDLLNNIHRYSHDIKIYLDNNYDNSWLTGLNVAKELHEKGFKHLYLLSGNGFEREELPPYLTAILKTDIEGLEKSKNDEGVQEQRERQEESQEVYAVIVDDNESFLRALQLAESNLKCDNSI